MGKKLQHIDRFALVILGGIILIGLVLRLYRLGVADIWFDEAYSLEVAALENIFAVIERTKVDTHPPLYYILLHFWLNWLPKNEFNVRLLSVLSSVLTLPVIYFFGSHIFTKKAGLLAAFLAALSPFQILYSQEARMYPLLALTAVLSLYFFSLALLEDKTLFWAGWVLLAVAALYTHYFALFLLPVYFLFFILHHRQYQRVKNKFLILFSCIIAAFLPWVPILLWQLSRGGREWLSLPDLAALFRTLHIFLLNDFRLPGRGEDIFFLLLGATVFFLLRYNYKKVKGEASLVILYLIVPVLVSYLATKYVTPVFAYRYLSIAAPALYILLGGAFLPEGSKKRKKFLEKFSRYLRTGIVALIIIALFFALHHHLVNVSGRSRQEWRRAVSFVNNTVGAADAVVLHAWWTYMPFQFYYQGEAAWFVVPLKDYENHPSQRIIVDLGERAISLEELATLAQDKRKIAIILSHDRGYDPEGVIIAQLKEKLTIIEEQDFKGIRVKVFKLVTK